MWHAVGPGHVFKAGPGVRCICFFAERTAVHGNLRVEERLTDRTLYIRRDRQLVTAHIILPLCMNPVRLMPVHFFWMGGDEACKAPKFRASMNITFAETGGDSRYIVLSS